MRFLVAILALATALPAQMMTSAVGRSYRATYYVANAGSDGASGLGTPANAKQTISAVNGLSPSAADRVLFNRGDLWREALTVPTSGLVAHPITFGAYGSGAQPIISSSDLLSSGWTTDYEAPVSADLVVETFNPTSPSGFALTTAGTGRTDLNGWVGVLGSGSVLDADNTDIADPLGGSSHLLKVQKVSANFNSRARWRTAGDNAITYTTFHVRVAAQGLGSNQSMDLLRADNAAFSQPYTVQLFFAGGTDLQLRLSYFNNGAGATSTYGTLSLDTWYKVDVKYDDTNDTWAWRVNGTEVAGGALTGTTRAGPRDFLLGDSDHGQTLTAYFDEVRVSTTGYYSAGSGTQNQWTHAATTQPKVIYFDDTRGTLVANAAAVDGAGEWFWASDVLTVFSTSDPATAFTAPGIEAGQRARTVTTNNQSYLTFDGLTIRDANAAGDTNVNVGATAVTGIVFQNCTVERGVDRGFDLKGSTTAASITVRNCLIQNNGGFGIWFNVPYDSATINGNTITGNGWRSVIENQQYSGIQGTLGNADIFGNTIDGNGPVCSSAGQCHGIYALASTVVANIHDNTITGGATGNGIKLIGSANVYRNSVHGNANSGIELGQNSATNVAYNIYSNLIYGNNSSNSSSGITEQTKGAGTLSLTLDNNTVYQNGNTSQQEVKFADDLTALTMRNNLLFATATRRTLNTVAQTGTVAIDHNLHWRADGNPAIFYIAGEVTWSAWQALGYDTNAPDPADPTLTSPTTDFTLQVGSPAINAGTDVGLTQDIDGNPIVSTPDIGAYEYQP